MAARQTLACIGAMAAPAGLLAPASEAQRAGEISRSAALPSDMLAIGVLIVLVGAAIALLVTAMVQMWRPDWVAGAVRRIEAAAGPLRLRSVVPAATVMALLGTVPALLSGAPMPAAMAILLPALGVSAFALAGCALGLWLRRRMAGGPERSFVLRIAWAILGAVLVGLVFLQPLLGAILVVLLVATGFGILATELWNRMRKGETAILSLPSPWTTEA